MVRPAHRSEADSDRTGSRRENRGRIVEAFPPTCEADYEKLRLIEAVLKEIT